MANDRIYLRCKECGSYILMAKYWGYHYNRVIDTPSLDCWLDNHASCNPDSPMTVTNLEVVNETEVVAYDPKREYEAKRMGHGLGGGPAATVVIG